MRIVTNIRIGDQQFTSEDIIRVGKYTISKDDIFFTVDKINLTVQSFTVIAVGSVDGEKAVKKIGSTGLETFTVEDKDEGLLFASREDAQKIIDDIKTYTARPKSTMTITIASDVYTAFMAKVNREEPHLNSFRAIEMAMINYTKETK